MPTFSIDGPGFDGAPFTADDWMDATSRALEVISQRTHIENLECEIGPEGDIVVIGNAFRFVVRERGHTYRRRLPNIPDPLASPSPVSFDALDAPELGRAPAWQAREEQGDAAIASLDERSTVIDDAPKADAAAIALDLLLSIVPVESGAVLLVDGQEMRFAVARGPRAQGLTGTTIPRDAGIAGLVARKQIALTVREAGNDPAHYDAVDRKVGYDTRAVLCAPLRFAGKTVGVLQLLNPFAEADFASWHLSAAQLIAGRLATRLSLGE